LTATAGGVILGLIGVLVLVGFDRRPSGGMISMARSPWSARRSATLGAVYACRFVRGLRPMIPAVFQWASP
jgi:hypothetical protein